MTIERLAITSNPVCKDTVMSALGQLDNKWRLPTKYELFQLTHSIGSYWVSDTNDADIYSISIMWGGPIQYGWSSMGQVILVRNI